MPMYDAIIIGGGYAGQAAAREIARRGLLSGRVMVVDRRHRAGYPPQSTSGIASYWLNRLGMSPSEGSVAAPIRSFRVHVDGQSVVHELKGVPGHDTGVVLHEDDFLGRMERESAAKGIEFLHGTTVNLVSRSDTVKGGPAFYVRVKEPSGLEQAHWARWVVDAGGYDSRASRQQGITRKLRDEDHHQGYEVTIPWAVPTDAVDIWMGTETAPMGYVWSFPASHAGSPALRVGVGTPLAIRDAGGRTVPTKVFFDRFIASHPEYSAKPLARMGGVIPTARPDYKPRAGRFISTGDAARMCSPLHGGGIAQALMSGAAAGAAIAGDDPSLYERTIRPFIGEMRQHWVLKQFILSLSNERLAVVVDTLSGLDISPDVSPYDVRRAALRALRARGIHPLPQMIGSGRFWRALLG